MPIPALLLIHQSDQQQGEQQLGQPAVEDGSQQAAEVQTQVGLLFRHLHDGQQLRTVLRAQTPPQKGVACQVDSLAQKHQHQIR